jgi:hypothetical protein
MPSAKQAITIAVIAVLAIAIAKRVPVVQGYV